MQTFRLSIALVASMLFQALAVADGTSPSAEEMEAWFNDDAEFRIADVNEGELTFLPNLQEVVSHKARAKNKIKILSSSATDGWVEMAQCHSGLDAVPLAQLVFPEYIIRGLHVTRQKGIATAEVEGKSIQMTDLTRGAELCVSMQIKALQRNDQGHYILSNGPYQRRFLDGYYPMKLELEIDYSHSSLQPVSIVPASQPGMAVSHEKGQVVINAQFEGVLRTRVGFAPAKVSL